MHWPELQEGDYIPYQKSYLDRLPTHGDITTLMAKNIINTENFLESIPADKLSYRYAEGKWTIKEIVGHLIDTERIMCYRALCIARGEKQSLPGFEEAEYAAASNANQREFSEIIDEYVLVRQSTIAMVRSFTPEMIQARGIANNHPITVNALCRVIAGHELHHLAIIKERYL